MYQAEESRYDKMSYKRCGNSGILLPRVSGRAHMVTGDPENI